MSELERLLSCEEAAEVLGVACITLRKWTSERRVPFIKMGKAVRYAPSQIHKWIEENQVNSVEGGSK